MSDVRAETGTPTFIDRYSRGEASPGDIDACIGQWHDTNKRRAEYPPLHEFLGLSHVEYEVRRYDPFALPCILRARRSGRDLVEVMAERYEELRTANRAADATTLFSLGNWLKARSRH